MIVLEFLWIKWLITSLTIIPFVLANLNNWWKVDFVGFFRYVVLIFFPTSLILLNDFKSFEVFLFILSYLFIQIKCVCVVSFSGCYTAMSSRGGESDTHTYQYTLESFVVHLSKHFRFASSSDILYFTQKTCRNMLLSLYDSVRAISNIRRTNRRRISHNNLADLGFRGAMGFGRFLETYPSESRVQTIDLPEMQYVQPCTLNRFRVAL